MGGVTIDSQDQYLIITGHSGIYSSNKAVEDIVTTKSDEVSIIRFCEMWGFNFSHEMAIKEHFVKLSQSQFK